MWRVGLQCHVTKNCWGGVGKSGATIWNDNYCFWITITKLHQTSFLTYQTLLRPTSSFVHAVSMVNTVAVCDWSLNIAWLLSPKLGKCWATFVEGPMLNDKVERQKSDVWHGKSFNICCSTTWATKAYRKSPIPFPTPTASSSPEFATTDFKFGRNINRVIYVRTKVHYKF